MSEVTELMENTLTVGQLRDLIETIEDDTPVVIVCGYGDRGNTQQAIRIDDADMMVRGDFAPSAYSDSGVAMVEDEDGSGYDGEEDCNPVFVLQ